MRYTFIMNPKAGNHKKVRYMQSLIRKRFADSPQHSFSIHLTEYAGHGRILARKAAEEKIDMAVSVGGDGTMNEVAGGLVHTDTALGVIPAGSGNGFARSMKIPLKLSDALNFLIRPNIQSIDAGRVDETWFFGVAGVGFDAIISEKSQVLNIRGPLPYFYIGIKEFLRYKYRTFTLITDNNRQRIRPLLIAFANTPQYGIGASIAPGADFRDGFLEICTLQKLSLTEAAMKLNYLFQGRINQLKAHSMFKAKELKICSDDEPILYHTDGESRQGNQALNIRIVPGALKVCCAA